MTRPSPVAQESCFRAVVASRRVHAIGPAYLIGEPGPERVTFQSPGYVIPVGLVPR